MLKDEIQEEINRLKRQISNYEKDKNKAVNEQKDLISVIDKIGKKANEIEDGLQQTLTTIDIRLRTVSSQSFTETPLEKEF